ncbi:MAG: transcriptional regulator [Tepidisphaeraceae bacterium]
MKSTLRPSHSPVADDYLQLIRMFPLRTLRSDAEHAEAIRILTRLLARPNGQMSDGERDYADVLGRLIDDFGDKKHPFSREKFTPLEMLRFLMRENGMNSEALGKVLGNKTAASLVLNGKRELSKSHIRRLAARFKVSPGVFF